MAIGTIFGIILAVLAVGSGILAAHFFGYCKKALGITAVVLCVLFVIALVLVPFSYHTVDTGEIVVVKHLGEATHTRSAGTYFDLWVTDAYQYYDAKVQDVNLTTAAYSSDAQTMVIEMTLQFQIQSERVMDIARQYGSLDILQSRITSIAIEKTKSVLSSFKAMDIIARRSEMSPAVETAIKNAIGDEYYVNVTTVVLTNIDFSDAFEKAVEDKMIEEQRLLQAEYENQTKIERAEADARALTIAAQAQADANRLLEESLTDMILRSKYIEKWDGKLPLYMSGEDGASILISGKQDSTD